MIKAYYIHKYVKLCMNMYLVFWSVLGFVFVLYVFMSLLVSDAPLVYSALCEGVTTQQRNCNSSSCLTEQCLHSEKFAKLAWISSSSWGRENQKRTKKNFETFTTSSLKGFNGKAFCLFCRLVCNK